MVDGVGTEGGVPDSKAPAVGGFPQHLKAGKPQVAHFLQTPFIIAQAEH